MFTTGVFRSYPCPRRPSCFSPDALCPFSHNAPDPAPPAPPPASRAGLLKRNRVESPAATGGVGAVGDHRKGAAKSADDDDDDDAIVVAARLPAVGPSRSASVASSRSSSEVAPTARKRKRTASAAGSPTVATARRSGGSPPPSADASATARRNSIGAACPKAARLRAPTGSAPSAGLSRLTPAGKPPRNDVKADAECGSGVRRESIKKGAAAVRSSLQTPSGLAASAGLSRVAPPTSKGIVKAAQDCGAAVPTETSKAGRTLSNVRRSSVTKPQATSVPNRSAGATDEWTHPSSIRRISRSSDGGVTAPGKAAGMSDGRRLSKAPIPVATRLPSESQSRDVTVDIWAHPSSVKRVAHSTPKPPPIDTSTLPRIPASAALNSHTPYNVRQGSVEKYYTQFSRIYTRLQSQSLPLAREHAVAQEARVYRVSDKHSYRTNAGCVLFRLKQRQEAKDCEDVGIDGEYPPNGDTGCPGGAFIKPATAVPGGPLTPHVFKALSVEDVLPLVLPVEKLDQFGYPINVPPAQPLPPPESVPALRVCERCTRKFDPSSSSADSVECTFHWGRLVVGKIGGQLEKLYTCCRAVMGSSDGCDVGPHVWVQKDLALLHAAEPFVQAPQSCSNGDSERPVERRGVIGIDCEMSYTTGGLELTRLTVIDGSTGAVLVDDIVRPRNPVIDFNTRFSGITSLNNAAGDLAFVRSKMFTFVDRETVIIGHSLESDFKALRLVHLQVVDTAELFAHPNGYPARRPLKWLAAKYLTHFIQNNSPSSSKDGTRTGHDSYEDAMACLELCRCYVDQGGKPVMLA